MSTDREPQAFSVAELHAWRGFLRTHAVMMRMLGRHIEEVSGLSLTEHEALLKLAMSETGSLPMSRLASKTYLTLSASGVSRLVDRLEQRGLVAREPGSSGDRRSADVRITDAGRAAWQRIDLPHQQLVRDAFLSRLTPEEVTLLADIWDRALADEEPITDEP